MLCLISWEIQEAVGELEEADALSSVEAPQEASTPGPRWAPSTHLLNWTEILWF